VGVDEPDVSMVEVLRVVWLRLLESSNKINIYIFANRGSII
jgi:hypothetical protein